VVLSSRSNTEKSSPKAPQKSPQKKRAISRNISRISHRGILEFALIFLEGNFEDFFSVYGTNVIIKRNYNGEITTYARHRRLFRKMGHVVVLLRRDLLLPMPNSPLHRAKQSAGLAGRAAAGGIQAHRQSKGVSRGSVVLYSVWSK
jgi:hypothetical protein